MTCNLHNEKLRLIKSIQKTIKSIHKETENRLKTETEVLYLRYLIDTENNLKNNF